MFQFVSRTSGPGIGHHWKEPGSIHPLCTFPPGIYLEWWGSPWAFSSPGWTVPAHSAFSYRRGAPVFCIIFVPFFSFPVQGHTGERPVVVDGTGLPCFCCWTVSTDLQGLFSQTGVPRRGTRITFLPHTATASMNERWQVSGQWSLSSPHAGFSRFGQFFSPFCQVKITYFPGTLSLVMWEEPPVKKTPGKFSD